MELGTIEAVKQALKQTNALGFLSRLAIENELRLGELEAVDVEGLNMTRSMWLVYPQDALMTQAMKTFIATLDTLQTGAIQH